MKPPEPEFLRRGRGQPILLIHGVHPVNPAAIFVDLLAEHGAVIAPSHPGFGASPRPADFDTMYDLVHGYLDVLDAIDGDGVTVIGFGFGGWIAAELATLRPSKLKRLVLVDAVGIKISGREQRDIVHFFNTAPDELERLVNDRPPVRQGGLIIVRTPAPPTGARNDPVHHILERAGYAVERCIPRRTHEVHVARRRARTDDRKAA